MQIVRAATTEITPTHGVVNDVISPTRLFAIARIHFDSALDTLAPEGGAKVPSSIATSVALDQVAQGVSMLRSVLVPSVGFQQRQRASEAIGAAAKAVRQLLAYQQAVEPFGDAPLDPASLSLESLDLYAHARSALAAARMRIS